MASSMGKPKLFAINLSGKNLVYFTGSNVEGSVSLELSEPKTIQGISIIFSGKAYVHWTSQRTTGIGDNRRTEIVYHSDTQSIFNDVLIQLWGNGRDSQELGAGRHEFPFNFRLPRDLDLPTSFESQSGYIRYSLLARMQQSWKFHHTTSRAITVNEIIDINTSQMMTPLSSSSEKTLCCLFCTSGPISLSVKTDRGGYCPGESIAISTEVENHSNRRIRSVQATLNRVVVYYAKDLRLVDNKIVQKIQRPGIQPNASSNWSNELLPIPATVPSISSCCILNVSYNLKITLDIPRAIDPHVVIPITIGNVLFQGVKYAAGSTNTYPSSQIIASVPISSYSPLEVRDPVTPPGGSFNYSTTHPPANIGIDGYTMVETQYAPVYGFVTGYRFAPPPSYTEATVKVKSAKS